MKGGPETEEGRFTSFLAQWQAGDSKALGLALSLCYHDLHGVAEAYMARERTNHVLHPSGLLAEVYLRLSTLRPEKIPATRLDFFRLAAHLMRHVLIDYARRRNRQRRSIRYTSPEELTRLFYIPPHPILDLYPSLDHAARHYPRAVMALKLRYFRDLPLQHVADELDVSLATVKNDLRFIRTHLRQRLQAHPVST